MGWTSFSPFSIVFEYICGPPAWPSPWADREHVVERLVRRKPVEGVLVEALRPEAHLAATQVFCKNKLLPSVSFSIMRFVFYLSL